MGIHRPGISRKECDSSSVDQLDLHALARYLDPTGTIEIETCFTHSNLGTRFKQCTLVQRTFEHHARTSQHQQLTPGCEDVHDHDTFFWAAQSCLVTS